MSLFFGKRNLQIALIKKMTHVFTAAALNLVRLDAHLAGKKVTKTQISRFATLAPVELAS
jgi:hypothetical protein